MANGLLLQYVNKCKNDYKHFMGVWTVSEGCIRW